jgi:hypothetical protein
MKTKSSHPIRSLILAGTITAMVTTVACSKHDKSKTTEVTSVAAVKPVSFMVRPQAPKSVAFTAQTTPTQVVKKGAVPKQPQSLKPIAFKSRDYGITFEYPWQYTRLNAKAIAADYSLQPQSDGLDSQITLMRVDVPKGFYPGTDLDSAYFTLSLNPDLSAKDCKATLGKDAKPQVKTVNGTDFNWIETESGGHGSSAKIRNYVAFANDTCYEIETGVRTRNDGLSREVDPDQVMKRLDSILETVKVGADSKSPAKQQLLSKKDGQPEAGK